MEKDIKKILENLIAEEEQNLNDMQITLSGLTDEWIRYRWKDLAYKRKSSKSRTPYEAVIHKKGAEINELEDNIDNKKAEIDDLKAILHLPAKTIKEHIALIKSELSGIDEYL
jgi:hypothetical protein